MKSNSSFNRKPSFPEQDFPWMPPVPPYKEGFVVHLLEPEPDGEIGGADLHVLELCRAQQAHSTLEPFVIINQNRWLGEQLEAHGILNYCGFDFGNMFLLAIRLAQFSHLHRIKLLHSHGYESNFIAYLVRTFFPDTWGSFPFLTTCHGWVETNPDQVLKTEIEFKTYETAQALVTTKPAGLKRLAPFKGQKLIRYIPNGIQDPEHGGALEAAPEVLAQYGIPSDKMLLGYVGRLASEKRIDILLKSCKGVLRANSDWHLVLMGSGDLRPELEELAKDLGIGEQVTFTGYLPNPHPIFQWLSVLMLTSDTEGTPRVILEAMAYGIPVIASAVGGVPELVRPGVNGFLAPAGDPEHFQSYLEILVSNPELRGQLGRGGREIFEAEFTVNQMQAQFEILYKELLGHPSHPVKRTHNEAKK